MNSNTWNYIMGLATRHVRAEKCQHDPDRKFQSILRHVVPRPGPALTENEKYSTHV